MFSLSQSMFVTQETIYSLQIMQSEQHPNGQISGGVPSADGAKESLSVYGLFHHLAGTPQGKASLRQLFYRPSMDLSIIMERQNFISLFRRPEYSEQFQMVAKVMRRISNVRRNIAQLQKGAESPSTKQSENRGAWAMLKRFVTHVLQLREIIATMDGYCEVDLLRQVSSPTRLLSQVKVLIMCVARGPSRPIITDIDWGYDREDNRLRRLQRAISLMCKSWG